MPLLGSSHRHRIKPPLHICLLTLLREEAYTFNEIENGFQFCPISSFDFIAFQKGSPKKEEPARPESLAEPTARARPTTSAADDPPAFYGQSARTFNAKVTRNGCDHPVPTRAPFPSLQGRARCVRRDAVKRRWRPSFA